MNSKLISIPQNIDYADLLLVYPDFAKNSLGTASYPENHLGLNRLASYLHEKGYKIKILNTTGLPAGQNGPSNLADYLRENKNNFNILGFHLNSWNVSHVIKALNQINKKFKDRLILFGGPLPTSEPKKVLELFNNLGYKNIGLVQGYGEFMLEKIIQNQDRLNQVEGVWSLQNQNITEGELQRFTNEEMESLPYLNPDYNTFYQLYYKPYQTDPAARQKVGLDAVYAAQGLDVNHGCPFNCSYCSVHIYGHSLSEYSPRRAVDELEYMARETGIFMYTYTNSNLLFTRRDWLIEFCNQILERKMDHYVSWSGYHHPNTLNLLSVDDFKLMKRAGCDQIVVGIQSVEPKILELFNRHKSTYDIFKLIREKTRQADLELVIDYIRGVPGEDLNIVEEFYNYCVENKIEMREFLLKIYPNTDIQNKKIDFSDYDLVPITGNMAPELDSYAVVPRKDEPGNRLLTLKINQSNDQIRRNRKIRFGQHYITAQSQAVTLRDETIPNDPYIPEKVKTAMINMLEGMLNPVARSGPATEATPEQMMKTLIMAGEDAPPMVKEMQIKLRKELGEEKFNYLRNKYENT